jgi:hypothetical protein
MIDKELKNLAQAFEGYEEIKRTIKSFLERKPLYAKLRAELPGLFHNAAPDVLILYCAVCKAERPFRDPRARGGGAGLPPPPINVSGVYGFSYQCTGCKQQDFRCWVEANYDEGWVRKIGQLPMWLAPISSEVKEELGDDSILYQKALRNMAEGYGIGACAYLRRLLEKHINPLLQLLHDVKKGQGASDEELEEIRETIMVKDFATKTKFAADIAPLSVMIEGHNPLKEIHQRLSIGLHTLDEETANEYAIAIHTALEFIIKRLRREYEERKVYAEETKKVRRLPVL